MKPCGALSFAKRVEQGHLAQRKMSIEFFDNAGR
jgi:hypothetical protein